MARVLTKLLFLLLCTAWGGAGAQALPAATGAAPMGWGRTPCPQVVAAMSEGPAATAELLHFMAGYSTARYAGTTREALAEADPFFGLPTPRVQQWLADACAAQPHWLLARAAQRFFDELPGAGPASAARNATAALGLQADTSTSCTAPALGACSGCSVTCAAPRRAQCAAGRDLRHGQAGPGRCGAPSQCDCR